jgi:hypothetical protein
MSLTATSTPSTFELPPAGQYIARCYRVIDLGTQETTWNGKPKLQHKVLISFELLDEFQKMADGRPFSIHTRYTVSTSEKALLRHDLESWRGQPFTEEEVRSFQIAKVLGKYSYVNIIHNKSKNGEQTYANIAAIMPLPKNMPRPDPVNEDVVYDLDDRNPAVFELFSDNLKALIMASKEWSQTPASADAPTNDPDDDIPF